MYVNMGGAMDEFGIQMEEAKKKKKKLVRRRNF